MTIFRLNWLADVLRSANLSVNEVPGWQSRGHGDFGIARGVLLHDTASNVKTKMTDEIHVLIDGRPDLAGPLCNLALDKDGTYWIVAAGKAWHAGAGLWAGISDGNGQMIGIEAENNGVDEPWREEQMTAYICGVAALLDHIGALTIMAAGHKEYALPKGRKIDPDFDMNSFRLEVQNARKSKERGA